MNAMELQKDELFQSCDAMVLFSETNRFYFTGFRSSYGCVVIGPEMRVFITDARYDADARKYADGFDVMIASGASLFETADKLLEKAGAKTVGYEENSLTVKEFRHLREQLKNYQLVGISDTVETVRAVKNDDEIATIAEAEAITYRALSKTMGYIKPGMTEKEVSDFITYSMLTGGAESLAFPNIVCFGANTAVPHHSPSDTKKLDKNDLILIDIGARFNGYCGDMTRTFSIGNPPSKLRAVHDIVLRAQEYALQNIRAGMTAHEADAYAREYIIANGYGDEFTHSLGHGVGVDIHETPRVNRGNDFVLKENMVISVEPGIYIGGLGGVRIEDLVVVKTGGLVNLTNLSKNITV